MSAPTSATAALAWLDAPDTCFVFRRSEHFVCAVNLGDSDVELPPALASMRTVLASTPGSDGPILPAASARLARHRRRLTPPEPISFHS